jgi:alpha-1,2-mannosyltransferase
MGMAVLSPGVPRWARCVGGLWVIWVCACLPLAVLPYAGGRERQFDFLQQLVANLGPTLGVILLVGLAWQLVVSTRVQPIPTTGHP